MFDISIIIPTWNEEQHLPLLLGDISKQTMRAVVIVADAQSTDRTRDVGKSFGAIVIDGGLPGPGRNLGAKEAKTEWLVFFDADIRLPDATFLERALTECKDRGLSVATSKILPENGTGIDRFFHGVYNVYMRFMESRIPHATGACILVKREVFEAVNGFDENISFAEDQDFVRRASEVGKFGVMRHVAITTSIRRLEHEGRLKFAIKYLWAEANILMHGFVKPGKVPYDLRPPR